jgi:flavin reductase (DIM6/NTAB) family NADH-FMN oxidoreductase RutF
MKKSLGAQPLLYPTPAWVICTYDPAGRPNMMTAAWGGICCSKPPCVGVSMREATHTYGSILHHRAFCVCVPSVEHVEEVDYVGVVSGRDTDKFARTGLTPERSDLVDAPYVAEFPLVAECRLLQTVELGWHTQFIGEILDVKSDPKTLGDKGLPDMKKVDPLVFAPRTRYYYAVGDEVGKGFSIGKELAAKNAE